MKLQGERVRMSAFDCVSLIENVPSVIYSELEKHEAHKMGTSK